ncbi:substrate-binding periplasmic protein [Motiliproteus sp.]|uniref:substrate-binding periplasmic protein n=1 Tax=Motiliproteus sp. TaxID=1898955 RepID=UPI003BA97268
MANKQYRAGTLRAIALLLFALLAAVSKADNHQLVTGEFPPFTGKDLPAGGLATDIITLAFTAMGENVEVSYLPWKRGYETTLRGRFLGTFAYSKNEEREKTWLFSKPLYNLEEVFIGLSGSPLKYESDADLKGLRICKPLGYNLFGLKKLHQQGDIALVHPSDMEGCFRLLSKKRVDLVMTNKTTAETLKRRQIDGKLAFQVLSKPFVRIGHHLIIPKTHPNAQALMNRFDASLADLQASGQVEHLVAQHVSPGSTLTP